MMLTRRLLEAMESAEADRFDLVRDRIALRDLLERLHNWFLTSAPEHYAGCGLWMDVVAVLPAVSESTGAPESPGLTQGQNP